MDQIHHLEQEEILKAQHFHQQHFPGQDVPNTELANPSPPTEQSTQPPQSPPDDLGFYPDGVQRTLTDEQIALFRHSEIQRLLAERRRRNEAQEGKSIREDGRQRRLRRGEKTAERAVITRFDDDATVHARGNVGELSYDEGDADVKRARAGKFQWPVLGS